MNWRQQVTYGYNKIVFWMILRPWTIPLLLWVWCILCVTILPDLINGVEMLSGMGRRLGHSWVWYPSLGISNSYELKLCSVGFDPSGLTADQFEHLKNSDIYEVLKTHKFIMADYGERVKLYSLTTIKGSIDSQTTISDLLAKGYNRNIMSFLPNFHDHNPHVFPISIDQNKLQGVHVCVYESDKCYSDRENWTLGDGVVYVKKEYTLNDQQTINEKLSSPHRKPKYVDLSGLLESVLLKDNDS